MMARLFTYRRSITIAKVAFGGALLVYLVSQAARHARFDDLVRQPKNWPLIGVALLATFAAVGTSFMRWHLLVSTLGLDFRRRDALRLGAIGYLFNFVSLGTVGGDLFKAILLAREQPGKRTEAVATVVIDRLVGLYALLVVASAAIWLTGIGTRLRGANVAALCNAVYFLTALGAAAFCLLLVKGFTGGRATQIASRVPIIGQHAVRLIAAVRIYRSRLPVVFVALAMSLGVHSLLTLSIFCIARGFPSAAPTLAEHFFIVPISMVAGAIPITPNGLGTFELAIENLYQIVPQVAVAPGTGTVTALGYRVVTLGVAAVGGLVYLASRREIGDALHDADNLANATG